MVMLLPCSAQAIQRRLTPDSLDSFLIDSPSSSLLALSSSAKLF